MFTTVLVTGGFLAAVALRLYVAYRFVRDPQLSNLMRRTHRLAGAL